MCNRNCIELYIPMATPELTVNVYRPVNVKKIILSTCIHKKSVYILYRQVGRQCNM